MSNIEIREVRGGGTIGMRQSLNEFFQPPFLGQEIVCSSNFDTLGGMKNTAGVYRICLLTFIDLHTCPC